MPPSDVPLQLKVSVPSRLAAAASSLSAALISLGASWAPAPLVSTVANSAMADRHGRMIEATATSGYPAGHLRALIRSPNNSVFQGEPERRVWVLIFIQTCTRHRV